MSETDELTAAEEKAICALERLENIWPKSLFLFAGSGSLLVIRYGDDGKPVMDESGCYDQDRIVATSTINADGGDF